MKPSAKHGQNTRFAHICAWPKYEFTTLICTHLELGLAYGNEQGCFICAGQK